MKLDAVPMDQAGRMVLPRSIRREMGLKSGDTFKVAIEGEMITLTPNRTAGAFVRKGKALVFVTPGDEGLSAARVREILDSSRAERDSLKID
jgi:AbrB family looped-hinge helix DNA binding protein